MRTFHLLLASLESLEKHNIISIVSQKDYLGFWFLDFFFFILPVSLLLVKSVGFFENKTI